MRTKLLIAAIDKADAEYASSRGFRGEKLCAAIERFVDEVCRVSGGEDEFRRRAGFIEEATRADSLFRRALAEALSVRRGHLSLTLCMRLSDDKDTRALFRTLDELVAKGVLVSGANGYHFGQDALREVFLRRLSSKRARRLYRRLGEALLQYDSGVPADLIEAGGEWPRARPVVAQEADAAVGLARLQGERDASAGVQPGADATDRVAQGPLGSAVVLGLLRPKSEQPHLPSAADSPPVRWHHRSRGHGTPDRGAPGKKKTSNPGLATRPGGLQSQLVTICYI